MDEDQASMGADNRPDSTLSELASDYRLPWDLDLGVGVLPRTSCVGLGEPWVTGWASVGRMSARRGAAELRDTPGEYVGVLMLDQGSQILVQRGRTAHIEPGSAVLWDGVRPVEAFSDGRLVKRTMFVPRELIKGAIPDLNSVFATPLPPSVNLRLLHSWLRLATRQPDMDGATAETVGRMAVELLRGAVSRARGGSGGSREGLLLHVKDFLDRNLADPRLSLESAAAANAISLRYLHRLFQGTGETARGYLRRRRLERAQELLLGPARISIAEIAWRSGFDSPSSFSHAYRRRFGVSPRDARQDNARG